MTTRLVIASDLTAARDIEQRVLDEAQRHGYSDASRFAIRLALEEGLNNAIRHGNRLDPAKTVEVTFDVDETRAAITITDQGCGFCPDKVPDPTADENLEKPSGRGIMLMRAYMDEVSFSHNGKCVSMVKMKASH